MIYGDFIVIYGDFIVIYGDLLWFMVIYGWIMVICVGYGDLRWIMVICCDYGDFMGSLWGLCDELWWLYNGLDDMIFGCVWKWAMLYPWNGHFSGKIW